GGRINALVRPMHVANFINEVEEGVVYVLKNYQVESNTGIYKTTICTWRLVINKDTKFIKWPKPFPTFRFIFRDFATLMDIDNVDETMLFDVIGVVVEIEPIQIKIVKGKPTQMIVFSLMNLEGQKKNCTLWGQYVDQLIAIEHHYMGEKQPFVIIMQMCRAKVFDGEVRITTSKDVTLIICVDVPEILEFRRSLAAGRLRNTQIVSNSSFIVKTEIQQLEDGDIVVSTVDSLHDCVEAKDIWVCATINSIIDEWWYLACTRCSSSMETDGGNHRCRKCTHNRGIFR
ncbi:Unknown protein, partial [Striga hermonthica]